jgi:phosphoserine phosphatase RsbU/P
LCLVGSEGQRASDQLQRLGSVSDPDLAALGTSELLDELLKRVQDMLDVDTVAVLLLDSAGSQRLARAARGLEEEVHQGVRVPVGRGFAGRIAATRAPVTLDHVGPDKVVNPILWRKGVVSMCR